MPDPLIIPDVASLPEYEGTDLGFSAWHVVDQARIDAFANATGDHQWIHVDPERAERESPFGGTIAHGYLTIALAPALLPEIVEVAKLSQIVTCASVSRSTRKLDSAPPLAASIAAGSGSGSASPSSPSGPRSYRPASW